MDSMAVTAKNNAKTAKAGAKAAPQTYAKPRCFQDIILTLQSYWAAQGCLIRIVDRDRMSGPVYEPS